LDCSFGWNLGLVQLLRKEYPLASKVIASNRDEYHHATTATFSARACEISRDTLERCSPKSRAASAALVLPEFSMRRISTSKIDLALHDPIFRITFSGNRENLSEGIGEQGGPEGG